MAEKNEIIIQADTLKNAVIKASEKLNVSVKDISYSIIEKKKKGFFSFLSSDEDNYTIKAWVSSLLETVLSHGESSYKAVDEINGSIQSKTGTIDHYNNIIMVKDDGIFVHLHKGVEYDAEMLEKIFYKRGVLGELESKIPEILDDFPIQFKKYAEFTGNIADKSILTLQINNTNTEAYLTQSAPQVLGGPTCSYQEILKFLDDQGIVYGIQYQHIQAMAEEEIINKSILVAVGDNGTPKNAQIYKKYYLHEISIVSEQQTSEQKGKYIDLKSKISKYQSFKKGDLVCERVSLSEAIDGKDIFGNVIVNTEDAQELHLLKAGQNIRVSDDYKQYFADTNGFVIEDQDTIYMTATLHIKENISYSTGHINVLGDVIITGDVQSGFRVQSSGSVIIDGFVQQGIIVAQGSINVKKGIIGADVQAKGMISAAYINSSVIRSGKDILCQFDIVNSKLYALGYMLLYGEKSRVVGGEAYIKKGIMSTKIGSETQSITLNVGSDPRILAVKINLLKEQVQTNNLIDKDRFVLSQEIKRQNKVLRDKDKKEIQDRIDYNVHKLARLQEEIKKLEEYLKHEEKNGFISCRKEIYAGVNIILNGHELNIYDTAVGQTIRIKNDKFDVKPYDTTTLEKTILETYIDTRRNKL